MRPPTFSTPLDLPALATNCEESAAFYQRAPGLAPQAGVVIDLYLTIAILARMVEDLQKSERS